MFYLKRDAIHHRSLSKSVGGRHEQDHKDNDDITILDVERNEQFAAAQVDDKEETPGCGVSESGLSR